MTIAAKSRPPAPLADVPKSALSKMFAGWMAPGSIPLSVKIAYTAFMAVLIPVYWIHYGPANFLYFCDLALFLTLIGVWRESPLLISMPAVGILAPQMLWIVDYLLNFAGIQLTGMTDYMFDETKPLYLRGLSLFHGWLPLLLLFGVAKLGYDKRAFGAWTALAWSVMLIAFFFLPPPSPENADTVANVNYVFGMSSTEPQTMMPAWSWLTLLMVLLPVVMFAPVHVLLKKFFGDRVKTKPAVSSAA
jgi:hypothetical protein